LTSQDVEDFQKIKVNGKSLISALSQNELAFRRFIRNARLQMREMERKQGSSISYDQKMELINNSILQFLLDKNVVNNFDQASKIVSSFNLDNLINAFPGSVKCNMANGLQNYKRELETLDIILSNYSEMLNRLFSATIVNSQRYIQYCNKDPAIAKHYESITNSLRNIVSNKDFLSQVCPNVVCPVVECKPCPQPMPKRDIIEWPNQTPEGIVVFHGEKIGKGNGFSSVGKILYSVPDNQVWFFSPDGDFVKIIILNLNNKTKQTGHGPINKNNLDKIVMGDRIILNDVTISKPFNPTVNDGYKIGFQVKGQNPKKPTYNTNEDSVIKAFLGYNTNLFKL
jgi:hypothetical protein